MRNRSAKCFDKVMGSKTFADLSGWDSRLYKFVVWSLLSTFSLPGWFPWKKTPNSHENFFCFS